MQQATALFGPIVEVRDVLESFLRDQVLIPGWRETLAEASRQFSELASHPANRGFADLGQKIAVLTRSELDQERTLTRVVAARIEILIDQVRVPDLPRPEDSDWSF